MLASLVSPWLADGYLPAVSSHDLFSVHSTPRVSFKDTNHNGLRPHPMTSSDLNYIFKGPISKRSHTGS